MIELVRFESGKDKDPADDDEDMGLNFPLSYVLSTWQAWRQFGVMPIAGGYNEQDAQLMEDWATLSRRYNWASNSGATGSVDIGTSDNASYEQW